MKTMVYCMSPPLLATADKVRQCILAFMPPLQYKPTQIKLATTLLLKETFDVIANNCATPHAKKPEIDYSSYQYKYLPILLNPLEPRLPGVFGIEYRETIAKLVNLLWNTGIVANENFNRHVDIVSIEIRETDFLIYGNHRLVTTAETKTSPLQNSSTL
jgi:hypothetical protein